MKNILVVLDYNEKQKACLENELTDAVNFIYKEAALVTEADIAKGIHGIVGNISPELIKKAADLEWVQLNTSGREPYLKLGVLSDGCVLHNAAGAYGRTVSEHMLGMTFALVRKLEMYHWDQMRHVWDDRGKVTSVEDSTVLVVGLGDIGGSYAKKMKALGAYVIGIRKSDTPKPDYVDEQYKLEQIHQVIGRADIVATVLPGGEETENLFDAALMSGMKEGAYLINCGRGTAVVLEDLKVQLDKGHIAGAALDVTNPEPLPADDSLWDYENVLITPHIAGWFHLDQTVDRIFEIAHDNLYKWLKN